MELLKKFKMSKGLRKRNTFNIGINSEKIELDRKIMIMNNISPCSEYADDINVMVKPRRKLEKDR